MESSFTAKYTLLITVLVASLTAATAMFFVYEKEFKPQASSEQIARLASSEQIARLEQLIEKMEKTSSLQEEIGRLKNENKKLNEMVAFYKEKNEFLTKKIEEIERPKQ